MTRGSEYPGWQAWVQSDEARALMDGPRQGSLLESLAFSAYIAGFEVGYRGEQQQQAQEQPTREGQHRGPYRKTRPVLPGEKR